MMNKDYQQVAGWTLQAQPVSCDAEIAISTSRESSSVYGRRESDFGILRTLLEQ